MVRDRMSVSINEEYQVAYGLSIATDMGDLEWRNRPYFALFHLIR